MDRPTVCLICSDVSGDLQAGYLASAIREIAPEVRLVGMGGPEMAKAGVEVAVYTTDLSFVGLPDSVRAIRPLVDVFRQGQELVRVTRPNLVVLVDSETLTLPAAVWLRRQRVPVVYFFPPQVWFWGRWRLRSIKPLVHRVVSAFREEADLYRAAGIDTVWVGHPLRDMVRVSEDPAAAMRAIGLDPSRPMVALMPGSRQTEVRALAGPMLGAARMLQERDPRLQFALPVATDALRPDLEEFVRRSGVRDIALYRPTSYAVLSRAQVVLQCSGTATLEVALLGIPAVIAYRLRPPEYLVGRYLVIDVPHIGMPNILLGEMVQPEFFKTRIDTQELATEAWSLLTDEIRRRSIQSRLAELPALLGAEGAFARAANAIVELLPEWQQRATEDAALPIARRVAS